ncbi:NUDIX domain-containing protein [bacterium]|nr:NUDIX domain-containing protein [bacterium]
MQDEMLDIVDYTDTVLTSFSRSFVYQHKLTPFIRSVWLVIKNKAGQLLIVKRPKHKVLLPGGYDGAAVGCVSAGEAYWQAMVREAREELGIDLTQYSVKQIKKFTPHEDGAFCFFMVYELELEEMPATYNPEDIAQYEWMYPHEILELAEKKLPMKSMLPFIARLYLERK